MKSISRKPAVAAVALVVSGVLFADSVKVDPSIAAY